MTFADLDDIYSFEHEYLDIYIQALGSRAFSKLTTRQL